MDKQKDAFYFPHFCTARHDRKIRRVRKELGLEGYGIFFMLLEVLREQADFKYPMEDIDLLADELGTSENKVRTVICNYQLFEVDEEEKFFSGNLVMYLQPYLEGKEKKRISGIRGNLIRHNHITKDQSSEMSDADILLLHKEIKDSSQCDPLAIPKGSQLKEIKVKEIKVNESKEEKKKKIKYGLYKKVLLTDDQYNSLLNDWGKEELDRMIAILDEGIELKGYSYKNHLLALRNWKKNETKKSKAKKQSFEEKGYAYQESF